MTEQTWSAAAIQKELSQMAWEALNQVGSLPTDPISLLQMHLCEMHSILSSQERYRQMWERVKRGAK